MAVLHNKYLILLNKIWKISESFVDACLFCPINYFTLLCQGFFSLYNRFFVLFLIWEWDDKVRFFFWFFFASPGTNNIEIKKKQKEQNFQKLYRHWQISIQHVHQYWSRIVQVEKTCSLKIYHRFWKQFQNCICRCPSPSYPTCPVNLKEWTSLSITTVLNS